jgi:hypothetical protein
LLEEKVAEISVPLGYTQRRQDLRFHIKLLGKKLVTAGDDDNACLKRRPFSPKINAKERRGDPEIFRLACQTLPVDTEEEEADGPPTPMLQSEKPLCIQAAFCRPYEQWRIPVVDSVAFDAIHRLDAAGDGRLCHSADGCPSDAVHGV